MISLLVAMGRNQVIGLKNDMPWHLPKDLKFFKEKTVNHTIIMGRKTYNSIGRILPQRKHVILTKSKHISFPKEVEVMHDISQIQELAKNNPNDRSEEHTSELQSRGHLVCRLLLEKKKKK